MFRPVMAIIRFLHRLRRFYISVWGSVDVEISTHHPLFAIAECIYIQGVPGGKDLTSGECSLGQTIPI